MSKVLILESDRILAGNLARYLRNSGHRVVWSGGPQAAIEDADKHHPEVIVMDLLLGGHGGVEFLYELRSYPEWHDLPVIILSSVSAGDLMLASSNLDALNITEFYYKPETSLLDIAQAVDRATQPTPVEAEVNLLGK